jgi:hypothetical protein
MITCSVEDEEFAAGPATSSFSTGKEYSRSYRSLTQRPELNLVERNHRQLQMGMARCA